MRTIGASNESRRVPAWPTTTNNIETWHFAERFDNGWILTLLKLLLRYNGNGATDIGLCCLKSACRNDNLVSIRRGLYIFGSKGRNRGYAGEEKTTRHASRSERTSTHTLPTYISYSDCKSTPNPRGEHLGDGGMSERSYDLTVARRSSGLGVSNRPLLPISPPLSGGMTVECVRPTPFTAAGPRRIYTVLPWRSQLELRVAVDRGAVNNPRYLFSGLG